MEFKNNLDQQSISPLIKNKGYELIGQLSEGSFAEVYQAINSKTNEKVVLKQILKSHINNLNRQGDIFIEKHVLASLNHPGLIKFYDCFQDEEYIYFVIEYCPYGDLSSYINALNEIQIKKYIYQLVTVIAYLHSQGIAHLDIKPNNLVIDINYNIKLIDFGTCFFYDKTKQPEKLTKILENLNQNQSIFVGTSEYVSPEMLKNSKASKEADLWAIGCIVYESYTGKQPFTGKSENVVFQNILNLNYDIDHPQIPSDAKDLINKLLQCNPNDRLGSQNSYEILSHPFFEVLKGYEPWNSKLTFPENNEHIYQLKCAFDIEDNLSQEVKLQKCSTATNLKPLQLIAYEIITVIGQSWFCFPTPAILGAYYGYFRLELIEKRKTKQMKLVLDNTSEMFIAGGIYYIKQNNEVKIKFKSTGTVNWIQIFHEMKY